MRLFLFLSFLVVSTVSYGANPIPHGFVLSDDDRFASHLVARGHHSWQTSVTGNLVIADPAQRKVYESRKAQSQGQSYFLFVATTDLPSLNNSEVLTGNIYESPVGVLEMNNEVVSEASFRIEKIHINLQNPFFKDEEMEM